MLSERGAEVSEQKRRSRKPSSVSTFWSFYQLYVDMVRDPPPEIFPIDNMYGKVTGRCEACYQAFVMPFTQVLFWWIIIPAAFLRNSLIHAAPDDDGSKSPWNWRTIGHLLCAFLMPALVGVIISIIATIIVDESKGNGVDED